MNAKAYAYLLEQWTQPHRVYHSLKFHLIPLLHGIEEMDFDCTSNDAFKKLLVLAAWWHDAVHELGAKDNEERSAEVFNHYCKGIVGPIEREWVSNCILATKNHMPTGNGLTDTFLTLDLAPLHSTDVNEIHKYESRIYAEYRQLYTPLQYAEGRLEFLHSMLNHPFVGETVAVKTLIPYISHILIEAQQEAIDGGLPDGVQQGA